MQNFLSSILQKIGERSNATDEVYNSYTNVLATFSKKMYHPQESRYECECPLNALRESMKSSSGPSNKPLILLWIWYVKIA